MKILQGIKNGALLQRDSNNLCLCYFKAEFDGEVKASIGNITYLGENLFKFSGIKAGGPYEIIFSDNINSVTLKDIYVGDLWILGGQSNMEGAGKMKEKFRAYEQNPDNEIRAFYMGDNWGTALPQLHQLWLSKDKFISDFYRNDRKNSRWKTEFPKVQDNGVGPGLYFAINMKEKTKVPQGLIPCGIGGSCLLEWKPDTPDNYYFAMLRRFKECGSNVKGVFWHQGEAQCNKGDNETYISDMKHLVKCMRCDFDNENLPFVQAQINKYVAKDEEGAVYYTHIREKQRTLSSYIENLSTVPTLDLELDDLIHLSGASHEVLGKRASEAMCNLIYGNESEIAPIELDFLEVVSDEFTPFLKNIIVHFKNVKGKLTSKGIPYGFFITSDKDGREVKKSIIHLELLENKVIIKTELKEEENFDEYFVTYGLGVDFYCNITDEDERSIPGFGPLKIKDLLR